jgi:hypothetical protein
MSESKIVDRRGEPKPERKQIVIYPKCPTCRYFEQFIGNDGMVGASVCVYDPPKAIAQIRGEDAESRVIWATWNGFPAVGPNTRCGKHSAAESN